MTSWFQMLVTATARPTGRPSNPQVFNIPNDVAIPAAAPPGVTIDTAVEPSVTRDPCMYESPGSAAMNSGAEVATFSAAARRSATIHSQESP